jgi:hypothetical protein
MDVEVIEWRTKLCQCAPNAPGILSRRLNPDVDVDRCPWIAVDGDCVGAHNQESRVLRNQCRKDIAIVLVHEPSY